MARPKSNQLTERELEIMHVFWEHNEVTAQAVRDQLAKNGRDLAYTTVATLIKILVDKKFVKQIDTHRPFHYKPIRQFDEVSQSLIGDLVKRVFGGSREQLLVQLVEQKKLTKREQEALENILKEAKTK